ncbi:hypothetical protein [Amycolatopsis vancoresmycina]|uniref:Extracellular repeat protein, HAF family n=1 Tax=Amycolatopsis vancoresmycina DSM 44592 TaxID=1292037 RepID=R1HY50_9PSEU|nr:hypothetical protein [Amycolatopsis vancoresmycina]EOD63199.1 extracellular repeat protein, HAF family [Amycolatopsis vancoresmycina DSM 44592]
MRRLSQVTVVAAAAAIAGIGAAAPDAAAAAVPQYRLVLGAAETLEYRGINARGDIIGVGLDAARFGREEGFVLKAGTTTPLFLADPGTNNQDARPRSINDQGVIVGNYQKNVAIPGGAQEITRPAIWPGPGSAGSDLGVNPTGSADAFGVTNAQQIVGWQGGRTSITPWVRNGTTVTTLPSLSGSNDTEALGENSTGVVVGEAAVPGGTLPGGNQVALEWANGNLSTLGQLDGGAWSEALAINTAGQAVGSASPAGHSLLDSHAVLFSGGKAIDLNVPRGVNQGTAHATAINTAGVIVGDDAVFPDVSGISNGFVYRNGHATELNALIAPTANVRLGGATGINDAGDIVGTAVLTARDGTVSTVGYELLPLSTT